MSGREIARGLLGLSHRRGQAEEEKLPTTPEELREITGLTWQPLNTPAPNLQAFWDPSKSEWVQRPESPLWEGNLGFGTRYKGWVILYGALPEMFHREELIMDRYPVLGFTVTQSHPEIDEKGAIAVDDWLGAGRFRPALFKTDSDLFPYVNEITWLTRFVTVRNTIQLNIAEKVTIHQYAIDLMARERDGGGR